MTRTIRRAIVRQVPDSYAQCISSAPDAAAIDVGLARRQHAAYVELLETLGVDVTVLPPQETHPDCIFTEDTAVVVDGHAVGCNLLQSGPRQGEQESVHAVLAAAMPLHPVVAPASLEGGDVLRHGDTLYVGLSGRTNQAGIAALAAAMPHHDVVSVPVHGSLHLKTVATIAGGRLILVDPGHIDTSLLPDLPVFEVPPQEAHGANCININGVVVLPDDCPRTAAAVAAHGMDVRTVPMSEFRKADGSLTCLSIRY